MKDYRDPTADTAIAIADDKLKAERLVLSIMQYVKKNGFSVDGDIYIKSNKTNIRYHKTIRRDSVPEAKPEPKPPRNMAESLKRFMGEMTPKDPL